MELSGLFVSAPAAWKELNRRALKIHPVDTRALNL